MTPVEIAEAKGMILFTLRNRDKFITSEWVERMEKIDKYVRGGGGIDEKVDFAIKDIYRRHRIAIRGETLLPFNAIAPNIWTGERSYFGDMLTVYKEGHLIDTAHHITVPPLDRRLMITLASTMLEEYPSMPEGTQQFLTSVVNNCTQVMSIKQRIAILGVKCDADDNHKEWSVGAKARRPKPSNFEIAPVFPPRDPYEKATAA